MQLQFSRRSDTDLDRLYEFLTEASHSIRTADKALRAIKNAAISLLDNPDTGTVLKNGTGRRELYIRFGKNNYALRYKTDYEAKVIRILRIWHSRKERK